MRTNSPNFSVVYCLTLPQLDPVGTSKSPLRLDSKVGQGKELTKSREDRHRQSMSSLSAKR